MKMRADHYNDDRWLWASAEFMHIEGEVTVCVAADDQPRSLETTSFFELPLPALLDDMLDTIRREYDEHDGDEFQRVAVMLRDYAEKVDALADELRDLCDDDPPMHAVYWNE